jgi:NhaP-type Na+/H+ or K+/H+ antiporter
MSWLIPTSPLGWMLLSCVVIVATSAALGSLAGWIDRWMRRQLDEPDDSDAAGA